MQNINKPLKIGVFDSGLGGLTVLKSLNTTLPKVEFIYLGDTARTPYGSKSPGTIIKYGSECASYLINNEVDLIVVACNTVSAYALDEISKLTNVPIIGTIAPATNDAVKISKNKKIGVIGTEATCSSKVYQQALLDADESIEVKTIACPLFVPLVEQGMFDGPIVEQVVELYLKPFLSEKIDTLILGCTHYPFLTEAISRYLGSSVNLVTCSQAIAKEIQQILKTNHQLQAKHNYIDGSTLNNNLKFFVTDQVSRFNKIGSALFDQFEINAVLTEI